MDKIEIKIHRPFGPSYVHAKIPIRIVDTLNKYIDKIIDDKIKKSELDFGNYLVGDVTQEFRLEKEISEKSGWLSFLGNCIDKWIEIELKKKITKLNVLDTWVVRQFKNEYNPLHYHSGHISGVGYLKVPKNLGEYSQKNKTLNKNGLLSLVHGSKMFLSESTFNIEPKVGDFYFFPHYLMHTVYPFSDSNEERRSISFNANIDDDIYNVYS